MYAVRLGPFEFCSRASIFHSKADVQFLRSAWNRSNQYKIGEGSRTWNSGQKISGAVPWGCHRYAALGARTSACSFAWIARAVRV